MALSHRQSLDRAKAQQTRRPNTVSIWTNHIKDPKDRQDFKELILSTPVLTRLAEILKEGEYAQDRKMVTKQFFDDPNWDNKVAFELGKQAAVQNLLRLITFQDQRKQ